MVTEISWGDGSGDKIYLTRNASEGDQVVSVSSDANSGSARSKVVTFTSAVGNIVRTLQVDQAAGTPQQYTISINPSSTSASGTVSNAGNAYKAETTTDYAQMAVSKTSGANSYIYFKFDTSSIPANATIDSVECSAKGLVSVTSGITPRNIQMFSGTTAKGSAQTISNTATVYTFSGETWSRSEVSDVRVRILGHRNSGSSTANLRFYGATLTITYTA